MDPLKVLIQLKLYKENKVLVKRVFGRNLYKKYNDGKYIYTHKPHHNFTTLEEFEPEYIWNIMRECLESEIKISKYFETLFDLKNIPFQKSSNRRRKCFQHSQQCAGCGIAGNIFLLQNNNQPYFSRCISLEFYHKSKEGLLTHMTVDHIIPRSKGGTSVMENLATMCYPCNQIKGNNF